VAFLSRRRLGYDARMRELHGVVFGGALNSLEQLKRFTMLFDRVYVVNMGTRVIQGDEVQFKRDLNYLFSQGVFVSIAPPEPKEVSFHPAVVISAPHLFGDAIVWEVVGWLGEPECEIAGIYQRPSEDIAPLFHGSAKSPMENAISAGFDVFPTPDETCALDDIFAFKNEMHDKAWSFRRFLKTLATKSQTEAEIRDDIEWTLNEYTKAMEHYRLKRSVNFMETYIIPTVEAFENLKPSSFLKGLIAIKKRKIEALEGQANAPGRECAYVFDALKRFGPK
jgi:hypothetical protein